MSKTRFVDTEVSHGKFTVTHDARTDRVIIKRDGDQLGVPGASIEAKGCWGSDGYRVPTFREVKFSNDEILALLKCLQELTAPEVGAPSPSKAHP